tara:strand:+ start:53338 stop:55668 length:2331 start_codon:yes stop_codon:yes gene_type:complete
MRFANQSTYFAALVMGATLILVSARTATAQQPGRNAAVVRVTDDLPFAPSPSAAAPTKSLAADEMPSLFKGLSKDTVIWPTRTFAIPFHVESVDGQAVQVQLLVSRGPGNQWRLVDQKPSTENEFPFQATDDGLYWFATRTLDQSQLDQSQPALVEPVAAQLKIFVDSTNPQVDLVADADASGRVTAQVRLDDTTPLRSVQLHYVTDTIRQWQPIDVSALGASGNVVFQPRESWQQLSLQAVVVDSAGHQEIVSKWLQRPRVAAAPRTTDSPASLASQTAQYRTQSEYADSTSLQVRPAATALPSSDTEAVGAVTPNTADAAIDTKLNVEETEAEPSERIAANPYRSSALMNGYRGVTAADHPVATNPVQLNPYGLAAGRVPPSLAPSLAPSPARPMPPATSPPQSVASPQSVTSPQHSVGGTVPWMTGSLPAPASPDQVTQGFAGPITKPATTAPPRSDTSLGSVKPESANGTAPAARPRTIADAMRPISENPILVKTQADTIETIPTPETAQRDPDAGSANRSDASKYDARKLSAPQFDPGMWDGRVVTRFSDSNRFSLDYELEAVGANGAKAIELWATTDGGKSWDRWGSDPDLASPFDIETKEEGVFGFRIVVVGQNGLTTPRPMSGETPDIVIVVDRKKPDVRITGASYGEGDRVGALVIRYACTDLHLMPRPIALSFSDTPDGPWTTIAAGLQNHGDYVWPADPQLPRKLYLRIDATDRAGNVGSYVLDRAIDAQGLAPRARIRGFQTLSGAAPPMANQQTAERPRATFK